MRFCVGQIFRTVWFFGYMDFNGSSLGSGLWFFHTPSFFTEKWQDLDFLALVFPESEFQKTYERFSLDIGFSRRAGIWSLRILDRLLTGILDFKALTSSTKLEVGYKLNNRSFARFFNMVITERIVKPQQFIPSHFVKRFGICTILNGKPTACILSRNEIAGKWLLQCVLITT
jgi:hypothetical protein